MQVLTHARGGCVINRSQNKNPWETLSSGCEWRHAPEARGGFGEIWKSHLVELRWVLPRKKTVDFCLLAETLDRCRSRWGCRWKSQNRKNVYLSPYVEEPLNSKVIKSFVPELRSRKCFSCFEIPMFYVHMLWTSHVYFTYSCIWLWYIILPDRFWFVHVPFGSKATLQFLAKFPVDHLPHSVLWSLILYVYKFGAFAFYMILLLLSLLLLFTFFKPVLDDGFSLEF